MQAVRVLLAALIAISIVLLPTGCGADQPSRMATAVAMTGVSAMPCCPSNHNTKASPACVVQCASIAALGSASFGSLPYYATEKLTAVHHDLQLDGEVVPPPRHPPRA